MLLPIRTSCDEEGIIVPKLDVTLPRKASSEKTTQPQTDTGSRGENKVSERTLVKELGKMTP